MQSWSSFWKQTAPSSVKPYRRQRQKPLQAARLVISATLSLLCLIWSAARRADAHEHCRNSAADRLITPNDENQWLSGTAARNTCFLSVRLHSQLVTLLLADEFNTRLGCICLLVDRIPRMHGGFEVSVRSMWIPPFCPSSQGTTTHSSQACFFFFSIFCATFSAFSPSSHCRDGCWKKYLQPSDCRGIFCAACEDNDMAFVAERGQQRWSYSREIMSVVYYCLRVQQIWGSRDRSSHSGLKMKKKKRKQE